jgi:hypothetical protein
MRSVFGASFGILTLEGEPRDGDQISALERDAADFVAALNVELPGLRVWSVTRDALVQPRAHVRIASPDLGHRRGSGDCPIVWGISREGKRCWRAHSWTSGTARIFPQSSGILSSKRSLRWRSSQWRPATSSIFLLDQMAPLNFASCSKLTIGWMRLALSTTQRSASSLVSGQRAFAELADQGTRAHERVTISATLRSPRL